MNYWKILNISPTSDVGAIKEAFAKASKNVHPEEHPEEFRLLHDAYKEAVKSAKRMTARQNAGAEADSDSNMANSRVFFGDFDSLSPDDGEDVRNEDETSETEEDRHWGPDIFSILDEEQSRILENAEFLTGQFLESITALSKTKAKNSDESWCLLFSQPDFQPLLRTHFFIEKLTEYVASKRKLPDAFYLVMSEYYSLDRIENRVDKGPLTGLYNIMLQRKRTHVLITLKRNNLLVSMFVGLFIILLWSGVKYNIAAFAIVAFFFLPGMLLFILIKKERQRKIRLESKSFQNSREISGLNTENEDDMMLSSISDAGGQNTKEKPKQNFFPPEHRQKKEKKWLPFAHIKDTRCYPAGSIFAAIDLVIVLFLIIPYITDNWIFCVGVLLSLIFLAVMLAVMLLTNIIVLIKGLIKKNRTMNRLHPLTFWIPFALFIIFTVAYFALPLPQ